MKKLHKGFIAPLVLVIVAVLLLGGYVWVKNNSSYSIDGYLNFLKNEQATTTAQSTAAEASDWKIYQNRQYNFEFKYPYHWFISSESEPATSQLLIIELSNEETLEDLVSTVKTPIIEIEVAKANTFSPPKSPFQVVSVAGIEGKEFHSQDILGNTSITALWNLGNLQYLVKAYWRLPDDESQIIKAYNHILLSFKLL